MTPAVHIRRAIRQRVETAVFQRWRSWCNRNRDFQPVFVAGAIGSGTSLLASGLFQRFECGALAFESARRIDPRSFLHVPLLNTFDEIASYRTAIEPGPQWSVDQARRDLLWHYRSIATQPGSLAIDKGPNTNLVRARFLDACFPKANWLLIFRDPVANVEGFRRKWRTFGEDSLTNCIRFYAEIHQRFLAALPCFQGCFMAVEYEDLVANFDVVIDSIGRRLGMVHAHVVRRLKQRANVEGKGLRSVDVNGLIKVVPDASRRAYTRLSAAEIAQIQVELGPLHEQLRLLTRSSVEVR